MILTVTGAKIAASSTAPATRPVHGSAMKKPNDGDVWRSRIEWRCEDPTLAICHFRRLAVTGLLNSHCG
jgi:hypothetical protein